MTMAVGDLAPNAGGDDQVSPVETEGGGGASEGADPQFEAWTVAGPDGFKVVSGPVANCRYGVPPDRPPSRQ
jgi:hypothetical protein